MALGPDRGSQHRERIQAHLLSDDAQVSDRPAPAFRRSVARHSPSRLGQLAASSRAARSDSPRRRHTCAFASRCGRRWCSSVGSRLRPGRGVHHASGSHHGEADDRDERRVDRAFRDRGSTGPRVPGWGSVRRDRRDHPQAAIDVVARAFALRIAVTERTALAHRTSGGGGVGGERQAPSMGSGVSREFRPPGGEDRRGRPIRSRRPAATSAPRHIPPAPARYMR